MQVPRHTLSLYMSSFLPVLLLIEPYSWAEWGFDFYLCQAQLAWDDFSNQEWDNNANYERG